MEKDLHVRMSDYDLAIIKEAAGYARLSPSAYCRMVTVKDAESRVKFFRRLKENGKIKDA